ncbi:MAG: glycosyltransferase family 4 protein, partial [Actinomycetes bacterium]
MPPGMAGAMDGVPTLAPLGALDLLAGADPPPATRNAPADKLGDVAAEAGLRRVQMVAWRDIDDPEAGGSELHAARVAARWAEAGLDVTLRTSRPAGRADRGWRDGCRLDRPAGRYGIFPASARRGLLGPDRPDGAPRPDGVVEIWN